MIRIPAVFTCKSCSCLFHAPSGINPDYNSQLLEINNIEDAIIVMNASSLDDATEIEVKCPRCNVVFYTWRKNNENSSH